MKLTIILGLILTSGLSFAQQGYTGIVADNFVSSGLTYYNPSSIVDSKSKFSFGVNFNNSKISNFADKDYPVYGTYTRYDEHSKPGYERNYFNFDVINLKYEIDHKNAFGYAFRVKIFNTMEGLSEVWSKNAVNEYQNNIINQIQDISSFSLSRMIFTEHGFTYARTLIDRDETFLKVGASFKILNGLDARYFYVNNGSANFPYTNSDSIHFSDLSADYGRSMSKDQLKYKNRGLGFDIGFSYEYRPNYEDQYYEMDGAKRNVRYDINKYKWKISGSITDIGFVRYMKDTASTYNFTNAAAAIDAKSIVNVGGISFNPYQSITNQLQNTGVKASQQEKKFRMTLPTSFHAAFDYNVLRNLYVSYNVSIPLSLKSDKTVIRNYFIHTITPRIEKNKWSFLLPISQMGNGKFYVGAAGRFSFKQFSVFVGSNNVSILYGQKGAMSRSFFAGLSYNVWYKVPKDSDKDKISDEKDHCPYDPGLAKYDGCPDTDGDGIIDSEDHCIYDKGTRATRGCPDRDGDGIVDLNDMCPDDPGLGIHYGCPDKDKDGVIDAADRCPDVPGIELNNGCPFEMPSCCKDDDGDGIPNELDKCPQVQGSQYNHGCPIDSTNLNKINLNKEKELKDANNTAQQVKDNPAIELRKQLITRREQLDSVMADKNVIRDFSVYFDVDQSTLTDEERTRLNAFVKSFPKNTKLAVVLIGYTDQDGSLDYNLILSKKRAETVQRMLIEFYGFDAKNISVYYYGETKSIHKGSYTKEMKQADRKVEIKLVKLTE